MRQFNKIKSELIVKRTLDVYSDLCIHQRIDSKADRVMTFCADARENFFCAAFFLIPFILNTFVQILEYRLKVFHALKYHWTLKLQINRRNI